jgi:hypothetical protein
MSRYQTRRFLAATLLVAAASTPALAADLAVTVTYTGKAAVDTKHDILVFLFADANITEASIPITVQNISKSGGTATFKNVTQDPVFVVMVFNEQANYTGQDGPPPPGLPWAIYGKGGKPIPVSAAKTPQVTTSFDDSRRWGK